MMDVIDLPRSGLSLIVELMWWLGVPCLLVLGCRFDLPAIDAADSMSTDSPPPMVIYKRRLEVVDAKVSGGPHTDFPLLVSLKENWLRTTAAGGDVASGNGFDIGFFADAAGTMPLAHEVELYNATTGTLIAWVKAPSLSAVTEIFLHYGDPSIATSQESTAAVWSNGFAGVWHLGGLADSTPNGHTGTDSGTVSADGQVGDARAFDGFDDAIVVGTGASIDDVFVGGGTVEAWFKAAGWGEDNRGRIFEKGAVSPPSNFSGWLLGVENFSVSGSILFAQGTSGGAPQGSWIAPANSVTLNTWTYVAVVYDSSSTANDPQIFMNGVPVTVTEQGAPGSTISPDAPYAGRIGNRALGDRTFSGVLDEVRLSRAARSADWLLTLFHNQSAPDAFFTVSGPL